MKRSSSSPSGDRNVFRPQQSPKVKAPGLSAKWKDFEKAPEEQRKIYARNVALAVAEVKGELAEHERAVRRSAELDKVQSHLQMKFDMVHEQFSVCQELANKAEQIKELFGVDRTAREKDISTIGLSRVAQAHVGAAVRDWQAKVDDTPWMKEGRALEAEQAQLLARKEAARIRIDTKKQQLEIIRQLKKDGALDSCRTLEEAKALIASKLAEVNLNVKKEKEEESDSESTPPNSQPPDEKMDSDSDQDDDFLNSI